MALSPACVPPCLFLSSLDKGLDIILRRTLEGALKCALRDLRLDDETVALYFIVPCARWKRATTGAFLGFFFPSVFFFSLQPDLRRAPKGLSAAPGACFCCR